MTYTALKLFSSMLIVGASFFIGSYFAEAESACYRQLSGMMALMAHMKTRIACTKFSLSVIFADFYDEALDKCGFLSCIKDGFPGYSAAFCEGVEKLSLPRPLKDELAAFGRTLGSVSMSEQFAALDRVQAVLSEKEGEMKAESEKKRKSYRSLGALAGAMVAVILY